LKQNYGVNRILGIRRGYLGLNPASALEPIELTDELVSDIDKLGGTELGSSRGPQDAAAMADFLSQRGIDILFCLGGDGTQRGAYAIHEEVRGRGRPTSVVGIPKTIDNDVPFVDISFGYATALEKAAEVIRGAHVEARDTYNGIGLVKLMGRHAGFIAAGATVVSQEVNFTLIPEIPFPLDGDRGLLAALEDHIRRFEHAVIVVAEGAGQHLIRPSTSSGQAPGNAEARLQVPHGGGPRDASGNVRFEDIGAFLRTKIEAHFASRKLPISLKYFDPSYHIRSVPAGAYDRFLCDQMARHAAHAAMAGKTGLLIGFRHNRFVHVPIPTVVSQQKRLEPSAPLWQAALQVTGQPNW
jgi:6-phosphofructokinase 1